MFVASLVKNDHASRSSMGSSQQMKEFFGDVDIIKKHINEIHGAAGKIANLNQAFATTTTSEGEQKISSTCNEIVRENNKRTQMAKSMLQRLREDNERLRTSKQGKESDLRIRENLANTLTRKFVEVMKEYQNAQQQFKQDIKKKVTRQLQIVGPVTPEEVDSIIYSEGGSGKVFQQAILEVFIRVVAELYPLQWCREKPRNPSWMPCANPKKPTRKSFTWRNPYPN